MEYILYIDVLFLTDMAGNFLALFLVSSMIRRKFRPLRALAAASLGGVWTCLTAVLFPVPFPAEAVLTMAGTGSIMTALTFSLRDFRTILKADAALVGACGLMAGGMIFFRQFFFLDSGGALICMAAAAGAGRSLVRLWTEKNCRGKERYLVRLYYRGKMKEFHALCDSGNRLREPVTGKPVSLISGRDCTGFCDSVNALMYIPYRAVGTEAGVLPGIMFEKMEIFTGEKQVKIPAPVVALVKTPLSPEGDFDMLLPEELVL